MNNKVTFELLWWVATVVIAALVILPIYLSAGSGYLFYIENVVSIIVFITLSRWIFLLRHTFFGWNKRVKAALVFLMIPLFFICYDNLIDFQAYIDEQDINFMLTEVPTADVPGLARYIRYEYIFFGTAAVITVFMIPFRMVMSIWRQINRGTV